MKQLNYFFLLVLFSGLILACSEENELEDIGQGELLDLVIEDPLTMLTEEQVKTAELIGERLKGHIVTDEEGIHITATSHLEVGLTKETFENIKFHYSTFDKSVEKARTEEFFPYNCQNQSSSTAYVKPEGSNGTTPVWANSHYSPRIDGVATPLYKYHVFKVPDFGRVNVKSNYSVTYNYLTASAIWANPNKYGWLSKYNFTVNGYPAPDYGGWINLFNAAASM